MQPAMIAPSLSIAQELFPRGIDHYLVGGLFVGLGIAVIYLGTGILAGNSTFLETTLSYVSDLPRFQREKYVASRDWRVVFAVSIVAGAAIYEFGFTADAFVTEVQWWRLLGGGILVGIGTQIGKGCTSGHGVSGIASLSRTSIVNVALFIGAAVATALVVAALGVTP
nr:YeeE/YedE thiosulfate transporter family protein [Natrinema soli]